MIDTAELRLSMFQPLVGKVFRVCDTHYQEDLTLSAAKEIRDMSGLGRAAGSFELTFDGSSTTHVMEQGLRRFRHEDLGEFEIMIAPRERLPDGTIRYTAVFN